MGAMGTDVANRDRRRRPDGRRPSSPPPTTRPRPPLPHDHAAERRRVPADHRRAHPARRLRRSRAGHRGRRPRNRRGAGHPQRRARRTKPAPNQDLPPPRPAHNATRHHRTASGAGGHLLRPCPPQRRSRNDRRRRGRPQRCPLIGQAARSGVSAVGRLGEHNSGVAAITSLAPRAAWSRRGSCNGSGPFPATTRSSRRGVTSAPQLVLGPQPHRESDQGGHTDDEGRRFPRRSVRCRRGGCRGVVTAVGDRADVGDDVFLLVRGELLFGEAGHVLGTDSSAV
ncbi:hypothetical protein L7F22_038770 [Adiantum nelumboides]|nr:hypothetical protein [Adiantum nelumboides]